MPARRLGNGWEPHVDEDADGLTYSQPVDSGFMSRTFSFRLDPAALDVLLNDSYRRAVLEVVGHRMLQDSWLEEREFTQSAFDALVSSVLYSSPTDLAGFVHRFGREHNIALHIYVDECLARRQP